MCTTDIGRLQRLGNHKLFDVPETSKPDLGANNRAHDSSRALKLETPRTRGTQIVQPLNNRWTYGQRFDGRLPAVGGRSFELRSLERTPSPRGQAMTSDGQSNLKIKAALRRA